MGNLALSTPISWAHASIRPSMPLALCPSKTSSMQGRRRRRSGGCKSAFFDYRITHFRSSSAHSGFPHGRARKRRGGNFLMVSRPTCVEGSGRQLEGGKGDKKAFGNFRRLNLPNHVRYFFFFFWHLCDIVFPNVSNIHIVETFLQKKWRNQVHRAFIWLWRGWRTLSGGDVHLVPTFFISSSYSPFSRSFSFSFWHFYRKHVIAAISPSLYLFHTKIGIFSAGVIFPQRLA